MRSAVQSCVPLQESTAKSLCPAQLSWVQCDRTEGLEGALRATETSCVPLSFYFYIKPQPLGEPYQNSLFQRVKDRCLNPYRICLAFSHFNTDYRTLSLKHPDLHMSVNSFCRSGAMPGPIRIAIQSYTNICPFKVEQT